MRYHQALMLGAVQGSCERVLFCWPYDMEERFGPWSWTELHVCLAPVIECNGIPGPKAVRAVRPSGSLRRDKASGEHAWAGWGLERIIGCANNAILRRLPATLCERDASARPYLPKECLLSHGLMALASTQVLTCRSRHCLSVCGAKHGQHAYCTSQTARHP